MRIKVQVVIEWDEEAHTSRVRRPSMGVDSEPAGQDNRIGALPDRRGPQSGSGTSSATPLSRRPCAAGQGAPPMSWYHRLPNDQALPTDGTTRSLRPVLDVTLGRPQERRWRTEMGIRS